MNDLCSPLHRPSSHSKPLLLQMIHMHGLETMGYTSHGTIKKSPKYCTYMATQALG